MDTVQKNSIEIVGVQYRPEIDGLRALAVMLVVVYHAFPSGLMGGFIGVDIFFVISGYLISNILVDIIVYKKASLFVFFQRRIRRLFPSLLVVLYFCLFVGWFWFTSVELESLGRHLLASATFTSNFLLMSESGYFDIVSATKPLLHLWSLAIEEQFYIIFPIFLLILIKFKVELFKSVLYLSVLSLISCVSFTAFNATLGFYFPVNRFWELLLGALLSIGVHDTSLAKRTKSGFVQLFEWFGIKPFLWTHQHSRKLANVQSIVGFAIILIGAICLDGSGSLPLGWSIIPCVGTVLIITAGSQAWLNNVIFSQPSLTWLGKISYPLYLWHWPLLSVSSILLASRPSVPSRILIIVLAAMLSHFLYVTVEKWFRYGGKNTLKVSTLLTLMALIAMSGYAIVSSAGFKQRPIAVQYSKITEAATDWHPFDKYVSLDLDGHLVRTSTPHLPPNILFIGDSHLEQFAPLILQLSVEHKLRPSQFFSSPGCPPIPNVFERTSLGCENNINAIRGLLRAQSTIDTIVIGACWNCYFGHETLPKVNNQRKFEYYYKAGPKAESFRGQRGAQLALKSLEGYLVELSQHYNVFLLLDNPLGDQFNPTIDLKNRLIIRQLVDSKSTAQIDEKQLELNEYLTRLAHKSGAAVLDQLVYLCQERQCTNRNENGLPIYKDDHHLRPFFVRQMTKLFEPLIHKKIQP
jgi:peptidoglycan/LPS O-acetylase OafA/YrhL